MTEPRPEQWDKGTPDRVVDAADELATRVEDLVENMGHGRDLSRVRTALAEYRYQRGQVKGTTEIAERRAVTEEPGVESRGARAQRGMG